MRDAKEILKVPLDEPERVFPNAADAANKLFRELALEWHPDRNKSPDAPQVMAHIAALHQAVLKKIQSGTWAPPGVIAISSGDEGKVRTLKYVVRHKFELGEVVVGQKLVSFLIDKKHLDLQIQGLRAIGSIRYPNNKWRTDLEQYFPKVQKVFKDDVRKSDVITVIKDEDAILLSDLVKHGGGALDPKHTAWVISSLLNLCAFFSVAGITHNGLSPETVFASPKRHAVYILGGWWYSLPVGKPMKVVPRFTHAAMSVKERARRVADPRIDLECVRAIGRYCIGPALAGLPKAYAEFLRTPASSSAVDDYELWGKVLLSSYGARRFVKLEVTPSAVYGG